MTTSTTPLGLRLDPLDVLFFRDGQYVTAIAGMQDWDVYLSGVAAALAMPPSRPPTIGIPVVSQTGGGSCH